MRALCLASWLLGSAGCSAPCPALTVVRADDELVAGTTTQQVHDALISTTEPGSVAWLDDTQSALTVALEPTLGTGKLAQQADCVADCVDGARPDVCGPDELEVGLRGVLGTVDGRLVDEPFLGLAYARQSDDGLVWRTLAEMPLAELNGTLNPSVIAPDAPNAAGDRYALVWLEGQDQRLVSVRIGVSIVGPDGVVVSELTAEE